ncbi:phage distal tail protein [Streptomyces buecherae]|uniref:Phage tail family protein n=1 Tax=Streptomyces buecherae TaxID=2763006 RepID=A0A7H8NB81_9ACTN|nr:phage tail domain-containing protein [Streptomyces buecherae]QKW51684.1 phage tail family protein [Streptomyces buecherae]
MAPGDLVNRPGHVEITGPGGTVLLGPGTPYGWRTLTGWEETPPYDSGTVPRAGAHGAYLGRLLAQPRTIALDGLTIRTDPGRMSAAVRALAAATALADDELPLVVQLDDAPPLLMFARCIRQAVPTAAGGYALGVVTEGSVQFEATDPRRYGLVEQVVETQLPAAEPGLNWATAGLAWPLEWGTPGSTGALTVVNEGDAPAHPVITFRGPVDTPSITNLTTGDVLEYETPLAASDVLTIDTGAGTVLLNSTASRLGDVSPRSVPEESFVLPPGTTTLIYRAAPGSDPQSTAAVRFRSAYW